MESSHDEVDEDDWMYDFSAEDMQSIEEDERRAALGIWLLVPRQLKLEELQKQFAIKHFQDNI